jgi:hypothetical protein
MSIRTMRIVLRGAIVFVVLCMLAEVVLTAVR